MDSQLIAAIRTDYETKPISELLSIWESNNQDEYSLEAFEAVKQLLISQNQSPLPSQKEFIKKHKAHFSQAQINQIIKKAMVTLFIWGAINIVSWFINVGDIVIPKLCAHFGVSWRCRLISGPHRFCWFES